MKNKMKPIIDFTHPWDEEYTQEQVSEDRWTHTQINPNLIVLQDTVEQTLQHLDSMLWDLKDAIRQGTMLGADAYISNAISNLSDAQSYINSIDIDACIEDIRQLQQQRLLETLRK